MSPQYRFNFLNSSLVGAIDVNAATKNKINMNVNVNPHDGGNIPSSVKYALIIVPIIAVNVNPFESGFDFMKFTYELDDAYVVCDETKNVLNLLLL